MTVVHYEVHVSEHPENAEIIVEPSLEDALRDAAERHGTVIEVLDFDE
jgi:hypothetical protein